MMTQDDILRMAREASCGWTHNGTEPLLTGESQIQRFAALVAAHEREACERLAWDTPDDEETGIRTAIALAIRARSEV